MTIPSVLIKDTLVNDGYVFGGAGDWRLWIGKMPPTPDRTITIYDSVGLAPNPRWLLDYPAIQIKVRGGQNDYQLTANKIIEIRNRLLGRSSYDAYDGLGDRIIMINGIGDVAFIGWDSSNRPEFVLNFQLITTPANTAPTNREPLAL